MELTYPHWHSIEIILIVFMVMIGVFFYGRHTKTSSRKDTDKQNLQTRVLDIISKVQSDYILSQDDDKNKKYIFDNMLKSILDISQSKYGFIGEILKEDDGTLYLKTQAMTNIAWDAETKKFYADNAPSGLEFKNLDTLFGHTIKTGEHVIANSPKDHPSYGGLPKGHPDINHYLGVPVYSGKKFVGMVGIANKKGGYSEADISLLKPIFSIIGIIIDSLRAHLSEKESLEKLTANEELFDRTVRGSSDGMWEWNIKTNQVYYSPRFKEMLGYKEDEFPGVFASFEKALHPDDKEKTLLSVEDHIKDNKPYDVIYRLKHKDASYQWYRAKGKAIYKNNMPIFMSGSISDISDIKIAEKELLEKKHTLEIAEKIAKVGNWRVDVLNGSIHWSPHVFEIHGRPKEKGTPPLEKAIDYYIPEDRSDVQEAVQRTIGQREPFHFIKRIRSEDGKIKVVESFGKAEVNDSGDVSALIGTFEDITKRREAEKRIASYTEEREQRRVELEEEKKRAESANQMKSDFLANMSHEIRTPMNGVIGMAHLLMDTNLNNQQQSYTGSILSSADALLSIIDDILDFSKIEAGKLNLEDLDFDFRGLCEQAIKLIAMNHREKSIEFLLHYSSDVSQYISGDPGRLRQIMINLLSNAAKFTESGHVFLEVKAADNKNGSKDIYVNITDTGIGIEKEKQRHIFSKFGQADQSTTRKFGGTGLGLSICKQLVTLMKGDIGVKSKLGEGSTFWLSLPLKKAAGPSTHAFSGILKSLSKRRILIVDGHALSAHCLKEILISSQMQVERVKTGQAALKKIAQHQYDAILLDNQMPSMSSMDIGKKIREDKALDRTALVLLTLDPGGSEENDAKQVGFDSCMTKPLCPSEVLRELSKIILHKEKRGQQERKRLPQLKSDLPSKKDLNQLKEMTILLVEDNLVNLKVAQIMLEKLGCHVTIAQNGQEAVDIFTENKFDLVFMDCQMPVMDGFDATKKIRHLEKKKKRKKTPIIAFTANTMQGDKEKCLAAGMDEHLPKPIKPGMLEDILTKNLPATAH